MYKSIVFSGIQPSGEVTIGNYIGVINQWKKMQYVYECIYCIADLHALTKKLNINNLKKKSLDIVALLLACGIDPNLSIIYLQSCLPEHNQLYWILNCYTYFGELYRMNQFKKSLLTNRRNISSGLFNYPVLMASDILLYKSNFVPIGLDQIQHLELVKNIAKRFNSIYGNIFVIPKSYIIEHGSKIMSLIDISKKMSKSDINKNNIITLLDNPDLVHKKIKCSITDSDNPPLIYYDPINKPGISNLLVILSNLINKPISEIEYDFKNKNYFFLKKEVINAINNTLFSIQKKYISFRNDENFLKKILLHGKEKAKLKAKQTINEVYSLLNLINKLN